MDQWRQIARREQRQTAWVRKIDDPDERTFWWLALIAMRAYFTSESIAEIIPGGPQSDGG